MSTLDSHDLEIVQRLPLLENQPHGVIDTLLKGSTPRSYAKGQVLFLRGDPAECLYVVLDGWVKVFRETPSGDEAVIGVFTTGESFAEAAAFLEMGYPASAEVVENARLLPIRTSVLRGLIVESPDIALSMLASLSRHQHRLVSEVEQLKTSSATQRVARFMLRLCAIHEGPAVVSLPYDKTLISRRLGMQPESLSRILAKLRKLGVKTEQSRVVISDVAVLVDYCEGEAEELLRASN